MMTIYTIGFEGRNAGPFFEAIRREKIQLVIDVRLLNTADYALFTRDGDIQYFLRELCGAEYVRALDLAPTKQLLSDYHAGTVSWQEYVPIFQALMEERGSCRSFMERFGGYERVCLLCF